MKTQNTLEVGQWIVHAHYGIGKISDIKNKQLGEVEKKYYCVTIPDGEYWLALENANAQRIRKISSKIQFNKALTILQMQPELLPDDHRVRAKMIDEQIGTGKLTTLAGLIRDIYGKRLDKGLNVSENQRFKSICKRFVDEWEIVMDISNEEAQGKLEEAFHQIAKNV